LVHSTLLVKKGIKVDYDPEIAKVKAEIATVIGIPDAELKIDPNFAANYAFLLAQGTQANSGWQPNLGKATMDYIRATLNQLTSQGFKADDMLQEGIQEALTEKTIRVAAVDKLDKKDTNEAIFKDGILYLNATPDSWGSWCSSMGDGIINLL